MAKVVAPEGFALELDSERMTFGHSSEVEVPLLPDLGVAEQQFTIVRFGDTHFIEHQADELAPTRVNGSPITKHPLRSGDEISAGDLILVFQEGETEPDEPDSYHESTGAPEGDPGRRPDSVDHQVAEEERTLPPSPPEIPASDLGTEVPAEAAISADIAAPSADTIEPALPEVESRGLPPVPPATLADPPKLDFLPEVESLTSAHELASAPSSSEIPPFPSATPEETAVVPETPLPVSPQAEENPVSLPTSPPSETMVPGSANETVLPAATPIPATPPLPPSPIPQAPLGAIEEEASMPTTVEASPAPVEATKVSDILPTPPIEFAPDLSLPIPEPPDSLAELDAPPSAPAAPMAPAEATLVESPMPDGGKLPNLVAPPTESVYKATPQNLPGALPPEPTPAPITPEAMQQAPVLPTPPPLAQAHAPAHAPVEVPQTIAPQPSALPQSQSPAFEQTTLPLEPEQHGVISPPAAGTIDASAPPAPIATPVGAPMAPPVEPAAVAPVHESPAAAAPVAPPIPETPPVGAVDPAQITAVAEVGAATTEVESEPDSTKPSKPKRAKRIKRQKKAKATKPKKIKRPRAPLFPFLRVAIPGAATLAVLLGGAYYGWENYFKPVEQPQRTIFQEVIPTTFSSAEVSAPDILRYLPQEAELAVYVDARAGFDIWSATMNPKGEPVYNPVDEFIRESAGVGLEQLDYLCLAGDAGIENFVAVVGFNTDLDPAALYSGIERTGSRLVRVETIGERPLRILHRDGIDFELLMVDSKTVLFSSPGRMRSAVETEQPRTAIAGSALSSIEKSVSEEAAFALAGTPETIGAGQIFEAIGCPAPAAFLNHINGMGAIGISATAHNDIELSLNFSAGDPQKGAGLREAGAAWLEEVPQKMRDGSGRSFPGGVLPRAIDRMLESARWEGDGSASSIRISIPRHDIPDLFRAFEPRAEDQAAANRALRDAQNFASLFASGVSCGNTQLPKAGSVDAALELLIAGVEGSGDFAGTQIRFPFRPDDAELAAISRHLQWQDNLLVCVPAP